METDSENGGSAFDVARISTLITGDGPAAQGARKFLAELYAEIETNERLRTPLVETLEALRDTSDPAWSGVGTMERLAAAAGIKLFLKSLKGKG